MFIEIDGRGFWNLDLLVHYTVGWGGALRLYFAVTHTSIKLGRDHPQYAAVTEYIASRTTPES